MTEPSHRPSTLREQRRRIALAAHPPCPRLCGSATAAREAHARRGGGRWKGAPAVARLGEGEVAGEALEGGVHPLEDAGRRPADRGRAEAAAARAAGLVGGGLVEGHEPLVLVGHGARRPAEPLLLRDHVCGRAPPRVSAARVGAGEEERIDRVGVAAVGGEEEGVEAVLLFEAHARAGGEEQLHDLRREGPRVRARESERASTTSTPPPTSQCPPCAAFISAVWPISSRRSASSTPAASSARTTSRKPPAAAAGSASARTAEERASSGAVRPSAARRISGRRMQRSAPVRAPFASALTARTACEAQQLGENGGEAEGVDCSGAWTRSASPRICGSIASRMRATSSGRVASESLMSTRRYMLTSMRGSGSNSPLGWREPTSITTGLFSASAAASSTRHHTRQKAHRLRSAGGTSLILPARASSALIAATDSRCAAQRTRTGHARTYSDEDVHDQRGRADGARPLGARRLCKALDVRLVLRGVRVLVHRERVHPHPLVLVEHIGDCRDQVREAALPAVRGKRVRLAHHAALATHRWQVDVPALPPFRERLDYTLHELRRRPRQVRACEERL